MFECVPCEMFVAYGFGLGQFYFLMVWYDNSIRKTVERKGMSIYLAPPNG